MHAAVADPVMLADATRQAELVVDKANPGVDADSRALFMMAYAIDRATKFAARDGAHSPMALAFGQVGQTIAARITAGIMQRVEQALAQD